MSQCRPSTAEAAQALARFLDGWPWDPGALDCEAMIDVLAGMRAAVGDAHGESAAHLPEFWTEVARCVPPELRPEAALAAVGRIRAFEDRDVGLGTGWIIGSRLVQTLAKPKVELLNP